MKGSDYVSSSEAADIIGCTTGRVRQLCLSGKLDSKYFNGRARAVLVSSAKAYARSRRKKK